MKFLLKLLLIILLICPSTAYAKTIKFALVSDVSFSSVTNQNNKNYTDGAKALEGLLARISENNYDFVVFLGDSINKSNKENLNAFLQKLDKINIPYYLVMGDKDVHKISGISKADYLAIVSEKNKNQKKKNSSYTFSPTNDIVCVVLDGVSSGMPTTHGVFSEKTLKWFDKVLEANNNKKVFVFQHVPYLEPYDKQSYTMLDKQDYGAVLRRHDNILFIAAGHYQQEYIVKDEKGVYHLTVPALSVQPYYYYEVFVTYSKKIFSKANSFQIDGSIKPAI